ncbi:hypothetical protein [Iodobacter sp.]|uniref:hypothetical protein n=1 Tax=Iodobacter sp. TaxID=1915058 RepID=UPI0025F73C2B|nr:hypothetical protein [Iodobacter sp.]
MANPPKRSSQTPSSGRKTTTKTPAQAGTTLPVTNPMDLWYLCQKAGFAQRFPLMASNGTPRYQRQVSKWVSLDCKFNKWKWPYYGEVGFDMGAPGGPKPIMSYEEPHRPSTMPMNRYEISHKRAVLDMGIELSLLDAVLTKKMLEDNLSPADFRQINMLINVETAGVFGMNKQGRVKLPGLLRIPDVIRFKDYKSLSGAALFTPSNIAFVIEMKFGNDQLWRDQQEAYIQIAGGDLHKDKLRLLETRLCRIGKRRRRAWLTEARLSEPVFRDVESKVASPLPLRQALAPGALLLGEVQQELEQVRRKLVPTQIPAGTPVLRAYDPAQAAAAERQREQTRQSLEITLAAPLAGAAAGAAWFGVAAMAETATLGDGIVLLARGSKTLIRFPAKPIIASTLAANAAIYEAAASPLNAQNKDVSINVFFIPE